jgi:hypothetical protein
MTRRSAFLSMMAGSALAVAVATLAAAGVTEAGAQSAVFDPDAALAVFHERVDSYVALHRRLAPPPAPGAADSTDPLSRLLTRQYLASAIRSSRHTSQQGDIFTPDVAAVFRQLLADSIGERDGETFLAELGRGAITPRGMHPTVNEPYAMTTVFRMPPDVRLGLPPLPAELDYRIAAHDLLLWDIYAGIVVDFVPNAFVTHVVTE